MIEQVTLRLPGLPRALEGLSIAVIADVHAGLIWRRHGALGRLVREVNAARPDLIAVLGDLVHRRSRAAGYVPALAGLRARLGVWACLGNHERGCMWYSRWLGEPRHPSLAAWRELYAQAGTELWVNEARALSVGDAWLCRTTPTCWTSPARAAPT